MTARCSACKAENTDGRKFCGECGAPIATPCASCGFANEGAAKFCGGCGKPLSVAAPKPPQPAKPAAFASPEAYTPKHLAERILTSKGAIEGERKQVTVLFADLKGSMELLSHRDPEEAREVLDPVLDRMMDAVHRYEGTVNQVMGDGIMALFGAPLALEDHAVRGCYAALAMQESIRKYADGLRDRLGVNVNIRVGLNSGEVVVRSIGSDLRMDYSAVGQTTHLAARMEQTATPGSIIVTPQTRALAEGYINFESLGPTPIKGLAEPMEVFEVIGTAVSRTRLQVSAARGLTRFVGRQAELEALPQALDRAAAGRGQVVALVGEAGLGKSRLFWEFTHSPRTDGWLILESRSVSYGKATTYLPVIELLKSYFGVDDRDEADAIRQVVTGKLTALTLERTLIPILSLLGVPVEDATWKTLDPGQRRQRTLESIKYVLLRQGQIKPLVLVFEDLHWVDSETQAALDMLVDSLPTSRILLLVNYRPEYHHGWGTKSHYTQIRMRPLAADNTGELLDALLGDAIDLKPLKERLIERTEGNPFFLEESVRTLMETHVLVGEPGNFRLDKPLAAIQMPATVQAILAARIDRLPTEEKRLLQSASVVGKDVPLDLLRTIAELEENALHQGLEHLQAGEFIYEMTLFPEIEYTFKHALTHEVAYASLLQERRRSLHTRMISAIEGLYPDRLEQHVERLALHAFKGEQWPAAVTYARQAGAKALARSAHPEAVVSFEQALEALGRLPESPDVVQQSIDLRFNLRNSLWPLGELTRLVKHLREAEALAQGLGDEARLGQLHGYMSQFFAWMGEHDKAVDSGLRARAIADSLGEFGQRVAANFRLSQVYYALGQYRAGIEAVRPNIEEITGERERQRFGMTGLPSVLSRGWLCWSAAELGEFDEAHRRAEEALKIAEASAHPFDLVVGCFASGVVGVRQGYLDQSVTVLERARTLCEVGHLPFWFPLIAVWLGSAYALLGRSDEARPLLDQAVRQHADIGLKGVHALFVALQGEATLMAGDLAAARAQATEALTLAQNFKERGHEAWALRLNAAIACTSDPSAAERGYREAIALANDLGMRPLGARCLLELGGVYDAIGHPSAGETLAAAHTQLRDLNMHHWVPG